MATTKQLAEQFTYHLNKARKFYRDIFEGEEHTRYRCEVAKKIFKKWDLNIENYYLEITKDSTTDWRPNEKTKILMTIDGSDITLEHTVRNEEGSAEVWYNDKIVNYDSPEIPESWPQSIKEMIQEWMDGPDQFIFPDDQLKYDYWVDENALMDLNLFSS